MICDHKPHFNINTFYLKKLCNSKLFVLFTLYFTIIVRSALNRLGAKHDRLCTELQNEQELESKIAEALASAE